MPIDWDGFEVGTNCFTAVFFSELWDVDQALVEKDPTSVGDDIVMTLGMVDLFRPGLEEAKRQLPGWRASLFALFDQVELLALPTLPMFPPSLEQVSGEGLVTTIIEITRHASLFNAAGTPCTAQPVPYPWFPSTSQSAVRRSHGKRGAASANGGSGPDGGGVVSRALTGRRRASRLHSSPQAISRRVARRRAVRNCGLRGDRHPPPVGTCRLVTTCDTSSIDKPLTTATGAARGRPRGRPTSAAYLVSRNC